MTIPVHLKYDLFAIDGNISTCFYHPFPFVILHSFIELLVKAVKLITMSTFKAVKLIHFKKE